MLKVFLLENVLGLGKIGEIKAVKEAYGYNFLLPKKKAVLPSDPQALTLIEVKKSKKMVEKENLRGQEAAIKSMDGKKFVICAKADKKGHLYGSVAPKEIAEKIGVKMELISTHFREIGIFPLEVKIGEAVAKIKIEIKNN